MNSTFFLMAFVYFDHVSGELQGSIEGKISCGDTKTRYVGFNDAHAYTFSIPDTSSVIPTFSLCNTQRTFDTELLLYDSLQQQLSNAECDAVMGFHGPGSCDKCDKSVYLENWNNIHLEPGDYYIEVAGWHNNFGTYTLEINCEITGSSDPTQYPTNSPTSLPSLQPTINPTSSPTNFPSVYPTDAPTLMPSTARPTVNPTVFPTNNPTRNPVSSQILRIEVGVPTDRQKESEAIVTTADADSSTTTDYVNKKLNEADPKRISLVVILCAIIGILLLLLCIVCIGLLSMRKKKLSSQIAELNNIEIKEEQQQKHIVEMVQIESGAFDEGTISEIAQTEIDTHSSKAYDDDFGVITPGSMKKETVMIDINLNDIYEDEEVIGVDETPKDEDDEDMDVIMDINQTVTKF